MGRAPQVTQVEAPRAGPITAGFTPRGSQIGADALGGTEARNLAQAGAALQQAGADVSARVITEANVLNETEALDVSTNYQRAANERYSQFATLRGRDAEAAYPQFVEDMRSLENDTLSGVNSGVRRMMQPRVRSHATSLLAGASTFRAEQLRVANGQAREAEASLQIDNGMLFRDNPVQAEAALATGLTAIETRMRAEGADAATIEAARRSYTSRFFAPQIDSILDTDPLRANAIFQRNRDRMDAGSQARFEDALRPRVNQRLASDRIDVAGLGPDGTPRGPTPGGTPVVGDVAIARVRDQIFRAENPAGDARRTAAAANDPSLTASGPGQITDGTWRTYAARLGLSDSQRNERGAQERIFGAYMEDAQRAVGRPLNSGEMYAAWMLGIPGFRAFVNADPNDDARAVYGRVAGDRIADSAFRSNGRLMQPGMTVGQVLTAVSGRINGGAPQGEPSRPGAAPDRGQMLEASLRGTENNPELRNAIITEFTRRTNVADAINAQERSRLEQRVQATDAALRTNPNVPIPAEDIRRLYADRPEEANRILDRLGTAQLTGQVFTSIQYASPQRLAEIRNDITAGTGALTAELRQRRGIRVNADGTVNPEDQASDESARAELRNVFATAATERQRLVDQDQAAYVQGDAGVSQAQAAVAAAPTDPAARRNLGAARRTAQMSIGVPEQDARTLTRTESSQLAAQITRMNPADGAVNQQLQGLARTYGPQEWPRVFRDLVRDGRLPMEYQILANMTSPVGQADYQRMLQTATELGGMGDFRTRNREAYTAIQSEVPRAVADFRRSANASGTAGGNALALRVESAVADLALYYTRTQSLSASAAVARATDMIVNQQYDFSGEMRAPKNIVGPNNTIVPLGASAVERGTQVVMRDLQAADLAPLPASTPGMSEEQRAAETLAAARRGVWVTNEGDDGVHLVYRLDNGGRMPALRPDGSRVSFPFTNVPRDDTLYGPRQQTQRYGANPGRAPMQFGGEAPPAGDATPRPAVPGRTPAPAVAPPSPPNPPRGTGRWQAPQ